MLDDDHRRELMFQLAGWLLFIICAILFIVASISNRDLLTLLASVIFLIACLVFIFPLVSAITGKMNG